MRAGESSRLRQWRQQVGALRVRTLRTPAGASLPEGGLTADCLQLCDVMLEDLAINEDDCTRMRQLADGERKRWKWLFETLPAACVLTDAAGVILGANRAAALLLNVSASRLRGQVLLYFASERAALYEAVAAHRGQEVPLRLTVRIRPREKGAIDVDAVVTAGSDSSAEGRLWFLLPRSPGRA
jgi:PAS domain-containing protein